MDPTLLAVAQQLALYSFEIPQNPEKIRSLYCPDATIVTNGESYSLDQFIAYLVESNTLNVTKCYQLTNTYVGSHHQIVWSVNVIQRRKGQGLNEDEEADYQIIQRAVLTFLDDKIIHQDNTLFKNKINVI